MFAGLKGADRPFRMQAVRQRIIDRVDRRGTDAQAQVVVGGATVLSAPSASTNSGSASMLPPPLLPQVLTQPVDPPQPCTSLKAMLGVLLLLKIPGPVSAVLPQRITLRSSGLLEE
jgi:hypothetical protein